MTLYKWCSGGDQVVTMLQISLYHVRLKNTNANNDCLWFVFAFNEDVQMYVCTSLTQIQSSIKKSYFHFNFHIHIHIYIYIHIQ